MKLDSKKNITFYTATEIACKIKSGEITSLKFVNAFFKQIEKYNSIYNAVITLNKKNAVIEAKKADRAVKEGKKLGLLHGVPITIKDSYETKGLRTTSGFLPLKDYIPKNNATVVNFLLDEGAIIIGKTNLPTLALDMQCDNPIFGKTNNPWDTSRTPGGSSGGCATALATGMTSLSIGSDLAGSIRQPSSFCGVFGLKPTFGVISKQGHIPPPPNEIDGLHSLAVSGPLARSIDDLELALKIMAQSSKYDRKVSPLLLKQVEDIKISDLKIAWTDSFEGVPVSNKIKKEIDVYLERLKGAGATVVKAEPININYTEIWETWGELVGLMTNFDKVNIFTRIMNFIGSRKLRNIPMHRFVLKPYSLIKYMKAINRQEKYITQMDNFLSEYDIWICPVSSTTAFPHHKPTKQFGVYNIYDNPLDIDTKKINYTIANQSYTTIFNATENPVLSMPIGLDNNNLPIGIQLAGKRFNDFRLLEIAKLINQYSNKIHYPLSKINETKYNIKYT